MVIIMIKLVVCDIDGTILKQGQNNINNELYCSLQKVKENMHLCFASGRTAYGMKSILGNLADGAYLISCDGAVISKDQKILYTRALSPSDVMKIIRADEYKDCALAVSTPNETYVLRGQDKIQSQNNGIHTDICKLATAIYEIKDQIVRVCVFNPDYTPKPIITTSNSMRVSYNSHGWCEYVSAIANKGLAVSDMQMRLYLSKLDTACFGDGQNDVEMMKKARLAISVNDSDSALDEVCCAHTDDLASTLLQIACKHI